MAPRSQPYRIEFPLTAEQAQNIDECFQILFDDLRNGAILIDLSTQVTGTLGVTHGGTGTSTIFTKGSIVFVGTGGVYSQNNSNLFWDNTNLRLGIGTSSPAVTLHAKATAIRIEGSGSDVSVLQFYDNTGTVARGNVGNNAGDVQLVASTGTLLLNGNNRIRAYPNVDSTSAFQFKKADATTAVVDIDTSTPSLDILTQCAVYGTAIPDAVNYERLRLSWDATQYNIFTERAGTGVARQLRIGVGSTSVWVMDTSGNFLTSNSGGSAAIVLGLSGFLKWGSSTGLLYWPATGKLRVTDGNATAGVLLDVTTDGTLLLRKQDDSADGVFSTGGLTLSGKATKYNNITTAGEGIPAIYSEAITLTQIANVTILTYTPPATAGRYVVSGVITTTSSTNTGTVQLTIDYKDSQGTTHTADIMPLTDAAGVTATTKTGASKEFHANPWRFTIDNSATNVVVKAVITGTVSYTGSAHIEQVA